MAGRDIGAHQRVLSVGAHQASAGAAPSSPTQTQAVAATATTQIGFAIALTAAVASTASAQHGVHVSAVTSQAVAATATAQDGFHVSAVTGQTVAATASAQHGVHVSAVTTQAVEATGTADSSAFVAQIVTQAATATASAEDGFVVDAVATQAVTATTSVDLNVLGSLAITQAVQATATADSTALIATIATGTASATASAQHGYVVGFVRTESVTATASAQHGVSSSTGGIAATDLYEVMHNRIRSRVATQLSGVSHLVFDNEREATTADSIWCDVAVVDEDTEARSYGGGQRIFRKRGTLRITVYGPLQRGDAAMLSVADDIRAGFSRVVADQVHYGPTSVGDLRRVDQRFQLVAETPFYLDDRMTRPDNVGDWQLVDREAAFNSIRSRFDGYFGSSGSDQAQTVVYDNAPTKPPADEQWVMFSIQTGSTEEIGAGVNAWARTTGIATAMICTPLGVGDQQALALADKIAPRFRSLTDTGVVYETPYVVTAGRREQWYQTNVIIRFRLEEILP